MTTVARLLDHHSLLSNNNSAVEHIHHPRQGHAEVVVAGPAFCETFDGQTRRLPRRSKKDFTPNMVHDLVQQMLEPVLRTSFPYQDAAIDSKPERLLGTRRKSRTPVKPTVYTDDAQVLNAAGKVSY